jgi:hypothetical protein
MDGVQPSIHSGQIQDKDRIVMEKDRKRLMERRVQNSAKKPIEIKHHIGN